MRLKFIILLAVLFAAMFWWAGDAPNLIHRQLVQTFAVEQSELGTIKRILRLAALPAAVEAKLSKTNYIPLTEVPLSVQQAFIAVEDNRFYEHNGLDLNAIIRASLVNLQYGEVIEGASTITQQLVKNLFLSTDRTLIRKLEEAALALALEYHYSKQQILEMYVNSIYFGENAYGIGPAARVYFNRPVTSLNLAESSLLAGLPNAPSLYSPYTDWQAAKRRQAIVLAAMQRQGYIDQTIAGQARGATLKFAKAPAVD